MGYASACSSVRNVLMSSGTCRIDVLGHVERAGIELTHHGCALSLPQDCLRSYVE